jgi:Calcium-binding EGF domain/EGF domain
VFQLPVIVERINRELDGVVDVEVEWKGSDFLKGTAQVGEHIIQCTVSRLTTTTTSVEGSTNTVESQATTTQCYHVPFTITDTNECLLRPGHPMRHSCDETSTICVNTIGSYECVCPRLSPSSDSLTTNQFTNPSHGMTITNPADYFESLAKQDRGPWELSYRLSGLSSCPFTPSTYGCCTRHDITCKSSFICPIDPCSRSDYNDCSRNAKCVRKATPTRGRQSSRASIVKDYTCKCPVGYMGNGHTCSSTDLQPNPKVTFDGVTPTEETINNNYYCDCTVPVVDACAGFAPCTGQHQECIVDSQTKEPKCACKKGYMYHEQYGCVDESPPVLILKHDPNKDKTLRLRQGDSYTEYAVDIHDVNAEEYLRSLKIAYSIPLPPKCFLKVTEFHVNYTIATPWTVPPYVRITRRVIIDDINECTLDVVKYKAICPELIPKCDPSAKCVNTIGSYKCQCPDYTSGDGFQKGLTYPSSSAIIPEGYAGGKGCIDTSKPIIQLQGPNPKKFIVAACSGVSGIMHSNSMLSSTSSKSTQLADKTNLKESQQSYYADDIKVRTFIASFSSSMFVSTERLLRHNHHRN